MPTAAADGIQESEKQPYLKHKNHAFYLWVVLHELLGHGTGKLLKEGRSGRFNFESENPPVNPITNMPVSSWYEPGQNWTSVFGDLVDTVDECRAECVGAYLMSDKELLSIFGYTENSEITAGDLEYNLHLQLGIAGLNSLKHYSVEESKWQVCNWDQRGCWVSAMPISTQWL